MNVTNITNKGNEVKEMKEMMNETNLGMKGSKTMNQITTKQEMLEEVRKAEDTFNEVYPLAMERG